MFKKVVTLDVGGTKYRTTLSTLTKYPDSMLGARFSGRHDLPQQEDGSYFIDRDGEAFRYILMYLSDRDHCCNTFCGEYFHSREVYKSPPSQVEREKLRNVALEAKYFQLTELESIALISLNRGRGSSHLPNEYRQQYMKQPNPSIRAFMPDPKSYDQDYGQYMLQCSHYIDRELEYTQQCISMSCKHSAASTFSERLQGTDFVKKITFENCDLSGVTFRNCYFQKGVSFEGCILRGTKFEHVGGLVRHKVHFAPWQVAEADFEPKLLQALKDNGCIY